MIWSGVDIPIATVAVVAAVSALAGCPAGLLLLYIPGSVIIPCATCLGLNASFHIVRLMVRSNAGAASPEVLPESPPPVSAVDPSRGGDNALSGRHGVLSLTSTPPIPAMRY